MKNKQSLIMIFYISKDYFYNHEFIHSYRDNIAETIEGKDILAFFLPTEGETRVECLNPVIMSEVDNERVSKIIEDIKNNFSIGDGSDMDIDELTIKPCECNNNPGGSCQC